jgi:hypothetical protein
MALLDNKVSKRITLTISLEDSTAFQVDQYASFVNIPGDEVVNKALEYVFKNDKEFQQYRDANAKATPSLRSANPVEVIRKTRGPRKQRIVSAE